MTIGSRRASVILFVGDILAFGFSLWLTLFLRYGELPSRELIALHAGPFAFLFLVWTLIFFMSGLYEKQVSFVKRDLSGRIVRTQVLNIVLAALLFFLVPALLITPKTILAIYLVISLVMISGWRLSVFPYLRRRRTRMRALLLGRRPEEHELAGELNSNPRYGLTCDAPINVEHMSGDELSAILASEAGDFRFLILDSRDPVLQAHLPLIYTRAFETDGYQIVDFMSLYEEVFDRVPLSVLSYEWIFRNATRPASGFYMVGKRMTDLVGGVLMGIATILIFPFVWLALRLEGPGPVLIKQNRLGERGGRMQAWKFRSMVRVDAGLWQGESDNRITRVGAFLRKTSLDEFPQFINILKGELSLVGPRNDISALGERLANELPYYRVRYLVRPGITGWAQVNQQYDKGNISPQSIEETKMRLAYDFYYLKHRSLTLDLTIALKTIKRMLFRVSPL